MVARSPNPPWSKMADWPQWALTRHPRTFPTLIIPRTDPRQNGFSRCHFRDPFTCPAGRVLNLYPLALKALGVVLLACFGSDGPVAANQSSYPFSLETEQEATGHRIVAHNRGPAPVSVRVDITQGPEIASDHGFPLYAVVPPNGTAYLAHLRPAFAGTGYTFQTRANWVLGDYNARQEADAGYRLPWPEGLAFRVSQAADGPRKTHTTPDSLFAVDIPMPEGTPILAARDGVVIDTEADETDGGQTPDMLTKANAVRILHEDGTTATYAHLAHGGVFVYAGQRVSAGSRIGLAGSTGYSSGPHLHFAVQKVQKVGERAGGDSLSSVSLPFRFRVGNPPVSFEPRYGMLLKADDSRPGLLPLVEEGPIMVRSPVTLPAPVAEELGWLMALSGWQWLAVLLGLWALGLLLTKRRRPVPVRLAPRSRPATEPLSETLSPRQRLLVACWHDQARAERLMEAEYGRVPGLSDDEAASRALERLIGKAAR